MDLECLLPHMYGSKVDVRGTIYTIGKDGICKDVEFAHAVVLLDGRHWRKIAPAASVEATQPSEAESTETAPVDQPKVKPYTKKRKKSDGTH